MRSGFDDWGFVESPGGARIYAVNTFGGEFPLVGVGGSIPEGFLAVAPRLLLDSNVVWFLRDYVYRELSEDHRALAEELLKKAFACSCDLNPYFYFFEAWKKSSDKITAFQKMREVSSAFAILHAANRDVFLSGGGLTVDQRLLDEAEARTGSRDLDQIAETRLALIMEGLDSDESRVHVLIITAIFKKIGIMEIECRGASVVAKAALLADFMLRHLVFVARAFEIGVGIFAGVATKFASLASPESYAEKVKSSVWDMLFLMLPDMLVAPKSEAYFTYTILVTREKALAQLADGLKTRVVMDGNASGIEAHFDILRAEMRPEEFEDFGDLIEFLNVVALARKPSPPSIAELEELVQELDAQRLRQTARGGTAS